MAIFDNFSHFTIVLFRVYKDIVKCSYIQTTNTCNPMLLYPWKLYGVLKDHTASYLLSSNPSLSGSFHYMRQRTSQ